MKNSQAEFAQLTAAAGIVFMAHGGGALAMDYLPEGLTHNFNLALDAQPALVTVSNAGIPAFLSNYMDPKVIEALLAPMRGAQIMGETQKGDWVTDTATFPAIEMTGEVAGYGDFNENGSSGANANFNSRQSFHYQTVTQWGEKELARAGLAKLDWATRLNMSSINTLNRYQNQTYFLGVSGLKLYGLLNDPALPAAIAPTSSWATAAAEVIYEDVRRLFKQLQIQLNGLIDQDTELTLAMSPTKQTDLNKTNQFNVNVFTLIKGNFPNIKFVTAPEYNTAAGELVQMIAQNVEGQETGTVAFTEKLRAHPIITAVSSYKQKKSQGTWGAVIYRPVCVGSMVGV